jgi:hypothetical protein
MYGDVRGNAFSSAGPSISLPQDPIMPDASLAMGLDDDFSWEMIGLGLDEPLPQQDFIDELLVYPPSFPLILSTQFPILASRLYCLGILYVHVSYPACKVVVFTGPSLWITRPPHAPNRDYSLSFDMTSSKMRRIVRHALSNSFQTFNLFRKNSPVNSNHPSAPLHGGNESRTSHAPSNLLAIRHVDASKFNYPQIRQYARDFLRQSEEVRGK